MSCSDGDLTGDLTEEVAVERTIELPASPEEVWAELPALLDDDDRVAVIDESAPARRLSLWWAPVDDPGPPSYVELELEPTVIGTRLRVRETRLDGAALVRSAFSALALA